MYERDLLDDLVAHGLSIISEPRAPNLVIPFHKVTSERFMKKDFKLHPYEDLLNILSQNSVKDIAEAEDNRFLEEIKKLYGTS